MQKQYRTCSLWFAVLCLGSLYAVSEARADACRFTSVPSTLNFGNILSGNSANINQTINWQCNGGLLGLSTAACYTVEPTASDLLGTTRLLRGTSGAALGYTLAFNLYNQGDGSLLGARTTANFGSAPQQIALTSILWVNFGQSFSGIIAANQAVPAGTYSTTSSFYIYHTSALLALLGSCLSSGNAIMSTVTITATILPNCNVSATNINFGTQNFLTQSLSAQGVITVNCTMAQPYSITLASSNGLRMMNGSQSIQYGLYSDPAYQNSWGTAVPVTGIGTGTNQTIPVYAQVLPQTTPTAGTYMDTVAITVNY